MSCPHSRCDGSGFLVDGATARPCTCRREAFARSDRARAARAAWRFGESKRKGGDGERELAAFLRSRGISAQRIAQRAGGVDSPDVLADLPFHVECKRAKRLRIMPAIEQAKRDADGRAAVVFYRSDRSPWIAALVAADFLELLGYAAPEGEGDAPAPPSGFFPAGSSAETDAQVSTRRREIERERGGGPNS